MIKSVAVIGIGSMGAAICTRLLDAGYLLTVCDVNPDALTSLARQGARVAVTPADCVDADLVIILVATPAQVRSVLLGDAGLKSGLNPQRRPWVMVMSTIPVDDMLTVSAPLSGHVQGIMDAPISGGLSRAEQGTLAVFAGAEAAFIELVKPVMNGLCSHFIHCGPLGSGQAMKIVNNIVGNANVLFTAEAYRLAAHLGLGLKKTAAALELATGRNFISAYPDRMANTYEALVRDKSSFTALLDIIRKDMGIAMSLTADAPGEYPAIQSLKRVFDAVGGETFETWRYIADSPIGGDDAASDKQDI